MPVGGCRVVVGVVRMGYWWQCRGDGGNGSGDGSGQRLVGAATDDSGGGREDGGGRRRRWQK